MALRIPPLWLLVILAGVLLVRAYTPAVPANLSSQGLGGTDSNRLTLQWYSNGSDTESLYYLLAGANTDGIVQGALLRFSEDIAGNGTTTTPWIALVPCDTNSTNASQELDIFTLARDRGAQAVVLYSDHSQTCTINPGYTDPSNGFEHVLDIFAIQSTKVINFINYEFGQFGPNGSYYGTFNATMLNDTASAINQSIASDVPIIPGPLFAALVAFNATSSLNDNGTSAQGSGSASNGGSSSSKTGLAMIILYAITGCVSALFCLVIISGAIRALRHPERYGPRLPDHGGVGDPGQSRARGLGQAILDTFPIVKFGVGQVPERKDVEAVDVETTAVPSTPQLNSLELGEVRSRPGEEGEGRGSQVDAAPALRPRITAEGAQQTPSSSEGVMPEAIGRETCPICILDFEEGDDLRVLLCEGKHRFHQACVDPWLLELSGSCPLCRQDFHSLEVLLSGEGGEAEPEGAPQRHNLMVGGTAPNRFSRYLRFARNRQLRGSAAGGTTE